VKRTSTAIEGPWSFRQTEDETGAAFAGEWLPAAVPGCVHTDLLANGRIGDPFHGTNERDQQWIGRSAWEYTATFTAGDALLAREHVELVCDGLDTFAEVFVNGARVLSADNMFRSWRAEVASLLVRGDNEIIVRLRSAIREAMAAHEALGYVLPAANDQETPMVSVFVRKAPYHFGWDWGPRFVTCGIWRPIRIEAWDAAKIVAVAIDQRELTAERAALRVRTEVAGGRGGDARVRVCVGDVEAEVRGVVRDGTTIFETDVVIDQPQRWWPNGLGPAHLYDIGVALTVGSARGTVRDLDDGADSLCDERRLRIGLREVTVIHEPDADGKSFTVVVNGAPVFMKGANYIPQDSFVSRVTGEQHMMLISSVAAANMNMLRVWGGGIYEDDTFYDMCDEHGILVWQDFMFACSMYPGDDAFVENVRLEAIENVRRLRHHACLALWAGNNEIEVAWARWGWQQKFHLSAHAQETMMRDCRRLFHEVLPRVVAEHDPGRFYTRSSPSANDDAVVPDTIGHGDMHYWGVWHAELPYERYSDNVSRFMSEYGFQSFPELSTVARYAPPDEWRIDSPILLAHQRHPRGNELIRIYMDRDFRKPKDFASFLYVSQVLQAVVIRYAAEAHRRRMPYNAGSLYWQLNDCWPVASWAGVDYFGQWKALHYFARRFFAPVLVSPVEENGAVVVYVVSDRREDMALRLVVRLLDFEGRELRREVRDVTAAGNTSGAHFSASIADWLRYADARRIVLVAEAFDREGLVGRGLHYFLKTKELDLPDPELSCKVLSSADRIATIAVSARRLALSVRLTAEAPEGLSGDPAFTDNYFDLLPGETISVDWIGAPDATFRAQSIRDTY
jgi:beta-mannosidase